MKRRFFLIAAIALMGIAGVMMLVRENQAESGGTGRIETPDKEAWQGITPWSDRLPSEPESWKIRQRADVSESDEDDGWQYGEDALSSTVHAVVAEGDTLVTGGYQMSDGRQEFTFVSPQGLDAAGNSPGKFMIRLNIKSLAITAAFAEQSGLDSLATTERKTRQHGETWAGGDMASTIQAAGKAEGADIITLPSVVVQPGQRFEVFIGKDRGTSFSLEGKVDYLETGQFALETNLKRTEER